MSAWSQQSQGKRLDEQSSCLAKHDHSPNLTRVQTGVRQLGKDALIGVAHSSARNWTLRVRHQIDQRIERI